MSDTNSRQGRTIPIWKMEPRYEDAVIEALENSYGEFPDRSGLAACLLETAKVIVEDNFGDYLTAVSYTHLDVYKRQAVFRAEGAV